MTPAVGLLSFVWYDMDGTLANSVPALPTRLGPVGTVCARDKNIVCVSVDSGVITCYNIPMTIMHMTLAELANSDPEMNDVRVKDRKAAPIPVWYATRWISGESVVTVYFSDGSIKHMSYDEACKL